MIGHYLLTLNRSQEDRVLSERLARAPAFVRFDGCRCLVGVVGDVDGPGRFENYSAAQRSARVVAAYAESQVGERFDDLCERFGELRVNAAIRNRILANQARRVLASRREIVSVPA